MKNINILMLEFDDVLKKYNPENYNKLQPPLKKNQITESLKSINLADTNFGALFEWKNGINISNGINIRDQIFDFGILYPLESVINSAINHPRQNPNLIPLIGDATGDFLLFNKQPGPEYGKIFVESVSLLSIDDPYSYFDSVHTMIQTTILAYEKGVLRYNKKDGRLDNDAKNFHRIV
jgi:hypothetical protein